MKHLKILTSRQLMLSAIALTSACGADGGTQDGEILRQEASNVSDDEYGADETLSDYEPEIAFQEMVRAELLPSERQEVEQLLLQRGLDLGKVTFVGRAVITDDVYHSVDDLLEQSSSVQEKGFSVFSNEGVAISITDPLGRYRMLRPVSGFAGVALIVGSPLVRSIMNTATQAVENAANDCISGNEFQPMSTLELGNHPDAAQFSTMTIVRGPRSTACPGFDDTAFACASYPSRRFVQVDFNLGQNRMTYGARIGLVDTEVIGTDQRSVARAIHELLHTMGVEHPTTGLRVPGTSSTSTATIMGLACSQASGSSCNRPETLQPDDIDTIDTLFSPQSAGSCNFVNNYELIAAAP